MLFKPLVVSVLLILSSQLAWGGEITGLWQEYDDDTGKVTALIRIQADKAGNYEGIIEKILLTPEQGKEPRCTECSGKLHNQPLLGLRILSGMKRKDKLHFEGGEVLDPDDGKIYRCELQLADDGNTLQITGYLGAAWIGQSEIWMRAR